MVNCLATNIIIANIVIAKYFGNNSVDDIRQCLKSICHDGCVINANLTSGSSLHPCSVLIHPIHHYYSAVTIRIFFVPVFFPFIKIQYRREIHFYDSTHRSVFQKQLASLYTLSLAVYLFLLSMV